MTTPYYGPEFDPAEDKTPGPRAYSISFPGEKTARILNCISERYGTRKTLSHLVPQGECLIAVFSPPAVVHTRSV
jgi:hypothetical protein